MGATNKRRKDRQRLKERYAKVREDAQLADIIPTTPEGAVRNEVVLTGNAVLPKVVLEGLRENWATPDSAKPAIVANLLEPFFADRELDADGKPIPPNRRELLECAKVLRMLDQTQHERDNPETVSGGGINITLQNTLQATAAMRQSLDADAVMDLTKQCFEVRPSHDQ